MNEDYCLWMGEIDPRMDEFIIRNIFQFYNVYPLDIKLIKNVNKSKNYSFIYFKNIYEANMTLNKLNEKQILNTPFKFKLNWANHLTTKIKTIYVGNLNPLVDDMSLFNFFKSKYKSVTKAKIIADNGQSKRYGFVTFKKATDYRRSLLEMNGVLFEGTNIKVKEYIKKDEDENDKNNQQKSKDNDINNKLKLNNINNNNINNNLRLYSGNFNTNSINKLNWISNANPINDISTGINDKNYMILNNKKNLFNQNITGNNYDEINNNFNNNNINYNFFINNDINNINDINNGNKNNNTINNNKTKKRKVNKTPKLEILEELDEKTLMVKINESLKKMLEYYKERILNNGNRVLSKLILYLIFV